GSLLRVRGDNVLHDTRVPAGSAGQDRSVVTETGVRRWDLADIVHRLEQTPALARLTIEQALSQRSQFRHVGCLHVQILDRSRGMDLLDHRRWTLCRACRGTATHRAL